MPKIANKFETDVQNVEKPSILLFGVVMTYVELAGVLALPESEVLEAVGAAGQKVWKELQERKVQRPKAAPKNGDRREELGLVTK